MDLQETIRRILREELTPSVRRRIKFNDIERIIDNRKIEKFLKNQDIEKSVDNTIHSVMYDIMPDGFEDDDTKYYEVWDEIKKYLKNNYTEQLTQYFKKRQRDADEDKNPLGIKYIFVKHDKPYENSGWRGFADGFNSFDDMITKYGNWVEVDWDEIKKKLDNINDYPVQTYTNTMNSRPLRISSVGDEGNGWGYNFSIIKQIPSENLNKVVTESKDPKTGTGKKPEGSGRRLYTDENPSDTVSVKFRTKEDIIDTLNKESFKSKPHKRQSQIINLIHQRVRAAYQNAKDPETKERLKRAYDYIEGKKEQSKQKTIRLQKQEQNEGELTERCWKGYTQKGMKTMFGKRYPNCVKIKKK